RLQGDWSSDVCSSDLYKAPTGQNYDSGEYDRALTKALQLARYTDLRKEQRERIARGDRHLLGIGASCYVEMCGFGPFESGVVRRSEERRVGKEGRAGG